jgi:hypothetical protein
MLGSFLGYGLILQAVAIAHFVRRRPDTFWLWIILMGGGLGAFVYIVAEVIPDASLLRGTFDAFPRRRQIKQLENAILDNPSIGNYEELGNLYLDDGQPAKARECFDRVITPRTDTPDPHYRRALALLALGELKPAADDLERVVEHDAKYDYQRAAGLLADTLGKLGETERAAQLFADVTTLSTLSETQYNYASFLAAAGRTDEARDWAQRVIAKKPTMPAYLRRRERKWFRQAAALLKKLPVRS